MILTLILNVILCAAVIVIVVSPLAWAILTQQRDQPAPSVTADRVSVASTDMARHTRRQQYEPLPRPAG